MATTIRSLCVYCGSSPGSSPAFIASARALGAELGRRGTRLVYGGGNIGLMGALASAATSAGAEVVGVIPKRLFELVDQPELSELIVTDDMHSRKARMAELSDAFVALPGGTGTLEELFEVWTWRQIGYHSKPIGLLDVDGYWQPLLAFLSGAVDRGFIRKEYLDELVVGTEPGPLLAALEALPPPMITKLLERRGKGS